MFFLCHNIIHHIIMLGNFNILTVQNHKTHNHINDLSVIDRVEFKFELARFSNSIPCPIYKNF